MVRISTGWLLSIMLIWAQMTIAATTKDALVDEVMIRSGLKQVLSQFPELLKAGVDAGAQSAPNQAEEELNQIKRIVENAFDGETIHHQMRTHLLDGLDETTLKTLLAWYNGTLGRKITDLELAATSIEGMTAMNAQVLDLQSQFKGSPREKLFTRYDKATGATESTLETSMAIQRALVGAFAQEDASPADYNQLVAMVEANRFMVRGMIGQQVYTSYLYTYASLSDAQIEEYIAFAESAAGQRFFLLVNAAVRDIMMEPSMRIGQQIMSGFEPVIRP